MQKPVPIETLHLFPKLDARLIELLKSLSPEAWTKPTLAKRWTVKDIAAHLFDGNVRTIAMVKENHFGDKPDAINSYEDLVGYLNKLNNDWVVAMRRMSPALLVELLEITGRQFCEAITMLDPFAPAMFSVAWAGEEHSKNWFHIAREYTEKWHHQQQIRDAVSKQGIMEPEFFAPLMQTFLQALPYTYRNVSAAEETVVTITIEGLTWSIQQSLGKWQWISSTNAATTVTLDGDSSWKLLTKGITPAEAKNKAIITGESTLADPFFNMISVMALR